MNILYIGQFSPKSLLDKYPDKGLDTYKTSEFLIRGFRKRKDVKLQVVTAPDVGSYPKFPQVIFRREVEEDGTVVAGFLNLPYIKQILISNHLFKEVCRIVKHNEDKTYVILPYVVYHYAKVGQRLKRKFGDRVIISQTVPDVFFPKRWLNRRVNAKAEQIAAKADAFVLFTKAMAEYFGVQEGKYIVMESVIDGETYPSVLSKQEAHGKCRVVYTGALGRPNGVGKLIEMMKLLIRDDFELWVTGRGAMCSAFEEAAKDDTRVKFLGTVPKSDVFKYQSTADILINPRSDQDAPIVTKYMFPSKLMEYMLTGNVTLTCRMEGIPVDYYNYVFVSEDDSPQGLASALGKLLDMPPDDRQKKGLEARQYILDNKTIEVQVGRIIELLKNVSK